MEQIIFPIRINRYLALKGLATRRGADKLISDGLVIINGKTAVLGDKVQSKNDKVEVLKDKSKKVKEAVYIAYYKPRGIVAHSPKNNEQSIADILDFPGVFPIGRLDKSSEGLIILTNDGRVTERLLHPRFAHEKEYEVIVREKIPSYVKKIFEGGVVNEGETLKAKKVIITGPHTLIVILTEGKNHQIRRMLAEVRLTVERLKRVRIMGINLGSLKSGQARIFSPEIRKKFLANLKLQELQ